MRHIKAKIFGGTCACGLLVAGLALAQPPRPPAPVAFEAIDANKDGKITPEEFKAFHPDLCPPDMGKKDFPRKNKAPDQMHGGPMRPPALESLDADKDGKLSWAEFSAPLKARFEALDTNKNGFVDADEKPKGFEPPAPPPEGKGPDKAHPGHDAPPPPAGPAPCPPTGDK